MGILHKPTILSSMISFESIAWIEAFFFCESPTIAFQFFSEVSFSTSPCLDISQKLWIPVTHTNHGHWLHHHVLKPNYMREKCHAFDENNPTIPLHQPYWRDNWNFMKSFWTIFWVFPIISNCNALTWL